MRTLDRILIAFAILVAIGLSYLGYFWLTAPVSSTAVAEDSLSIAKDPLQIMVNSEYIPAIERSGYRILLNARASYRLDGILVSKKHYSGGIMNWLGPWDYAVVWGAVPQQLKYLKFKQAVRYALFRYDPSVPIDVSYIMTHSSNNHLIPATPNLRKALSRAKKHSQVRLEGFLVEVTVIKNGKGSNNWNSSLTRTDTGNGACELIYLKRLRLGDQIYE